MSRSISDVCGTCRYYHHPDGGQTGSCRRYPVYQLRHENAWCGEYAVFRAMALEVVVSYPAEPTIKRGRGRPFKNPQENKNAQTAEI